MLLDVRIDTIDKIKDFINKVNTLEGDFDLKSDRYTVDAKSIMGIFSLDVSNDLTLAFNGDLDNVKETLKDFIVE